ncbi:TreY: malto-oligosyltrehalose synthase [Desulfosarcina variabilis str. Montpellier]|uniref:malto-oligosyltrehalose synthase n=1 Tax=Desulfosarcina variabilis TaxID=2300 RepID=UPI003AFB2794
MNIPHATYRLQFNPQFRFRQAAKIVSYLADLGVSHVYASPVFKARQGSAHGYDGVDPNQLNPELGTGSDFEGLHRKLKQRRIGWLQDIVPNHMAFDGANRMLMDVLEHGPHSPYAAFFDIGWHGPGSATPERLMAPFLGRRYAQCLEDGELKLSFDASGFAVNYYQLRLPLKIESYLILLKAIAERLESKAGDNQVGDAPLADVINCIEAIDARSNADTRRQETRRVKKALFDLYDGNGKVRQCIEQTLWHYSQGRDAGGRVDDLDRLLSDQFFRLCHWTVAGQIINYRRFFDINELICLRQENRAVFDGTHGLIKQLVDDGYIDGVRIDHIDGLADPAAYLRRLRAHLGDIYIVVEKILQAEESLPTGWPIQGTTGYDFTQRLNGLFCATDNEAIFDDIYNAFTGQTTDFDHLLVDCKRRFLKEQFGGDLHNLVDRILHAAGQPRNGRQLTRQGLMQSLTQILIRFPVYRTYIDQNGPNAADRACIQAAVASARQDSASPAPEMTFLSQLLLDANVKPTGIGPATDVDPIIVKFQQLTAPLMAKGLEDTALYIYSRLISLNDVGGDPRRFGCRPHDFHAFIKTRADRWPHTMNSSATHDSKRGEDVRARINVLSEMPKAWRDHLSRWHGLNQVKKNRIDGAPVPDRNEEYLLYQTLLGAYPFDNPPGTAFTQRISRYMVKALREAKIHSSWIKVNAPYEDAACAFIEKILHPTEDGSFLQAFLPFWKKVAFYGIWNSLSQTLLKITVPGVPDFYQGTELFDFNLVDPDNRRPVDVDKRKRLLADMLNHFSSDPLGLIEALLTHRDDGRIKLFLIARALRARKKRARVYQAGSYVPLAIAGRFKAHVIAFARMHDARCSITVVPRLLTGLIEAHQYPLGRRVWQDTEIVFPCTTARRWKNSFTGEIVEAATSVNVGRILNHFPCALLEDTQ